MTPVIRLYDPRHISQNQKLCYHVFMKQRTLEPSLVQLLRIYTIISAVLIPLLWRMLSSTLGVRTSSLLVFIHPGEPVLLFLVVYLSVPWWQRIMGRLFLPVALLLLAAQSVLGNYLTLQWFIPPDV